MFLQTVRVAQTIKSMLIWGVNRVNACNHNNLSIRVVANECISQNHSQFWLAIGNMFSFINTPYTLLQSQKALVDLGSFQTTLFVIAHCIRSSFRSRQINEAQLTRKGPITSHSDFTDRMWPGTVIIWHSTVCCPHRIAIFYNSQQFIWRYYLLISYSINHYSMVTILLYLQFCLIVE